ncbi:hypothetical protein [Lacinutrix sp. MEBiC02404]
MKTLIILIVLSLNIPSHDITEGIFERKLINIRVPNFGNYSSSVEVYSVFGEKTGCKVSLKENNTSGVVIIQYRINNKGKWYTLVEGQYIKGQSIWCRVKGLGGSGSVVLAIE